MSRATVPVRSSPHVIGRLTILTVAQLPEPVELEAHETDGPLVALRHPDGLLDVEHGDLTPRKIRRGVDEA